MKKIMAITEQIKVIRKEIRFCNEMEKSVSAIRREIKKIEEQEKIQKVFKRIMKKEKDMKDRIGAEMHQFLYC